MSVQAGLSAIRVSDPVPSKGIAAERRPSAGPLRLALIGCGAISRQLHLPILAGHEGIKLAALVDRDAVRARELAKGYGVDKVFGDAAELSRDQIDAAVVATPPFHHAPCTIDLLRRGIHVLVEKPMATNYADALAMVRRAEETGNVLSVGFFRRLMPSMRVFKSLVESHWLGRPVGFEVACGGFYKWSAATLGNMRKELAGGGVLIDFGSHMLDLLHYLFGPDGEVLEYRDNALGGIESDCLLRLRLGHRGEAVEGRMELSRTRKLGHWRLRVLCERGDLEYRITERYRIWVTPRDLRLTDPARGEVRPYCMQASWADEPETDWYETVRAEIDDWLGAIRTGEQPELNGRSALPTARVIEECYRRVQPLEEPWVREGLGPRPGAAPSGNGKPRRVLLTGATGFIGSRVAEILALRDGWQVRALVHDPANASRLARLPVEMVQADLGDEQQVNRLVEGCDAVVHCAIGTTWGERKKIFAVNVEGTRLLARAALARGVRRFIHFSTIAVHDPTMSGTMDESTPLRPIKGGDYGESKVESEKVVLQAARDGLPAVVFRPACVYGPFSRIFITRPMEALPEGRFRLIGGADGPSNMVYVDNVIEAVVRALEAPEETVKGEVFTISEPDQLSWREFYEYFAEALGHELPVEEAGEPKRQARRRRLGLFTWPLSWFRGIKTVFTSAEFRALGQRVLQTDPLGTLPRRVLERFPGLKERVRRLVKADGLPIARRSPTADRTNDDVVEMGASRYLVSCEKARRVLGYTPIVSRERAMALTLEWIRYARLVSGQDDAGR